MKTKIEANQIDKKSDIQRKESDTTLNSNATNTTSKNPSRHHPYAVYGRNKTAGKKEQSDASDCNTKINE